MSSQSWQDQGRLSDDDGEGGIQESVSWGRMAEWMGESGGEEKESSLSLGGRDRQIVRVGREEGRQPWDGLGDWFRSLAL